MTWWRRPRRNYTRGPKRKAECANYWGSAAVIGAQRPLTGHQPGEPPRSPSLRSPGSVPQFQALEPPRSPSCLGGVPTPYHLLTSSPQGHVGRPVQHAFTRHKPGEPPRLSLAWLVVSEYASPLT